MSCVCRRHPDVEVTWRGTGCPHCATTRPRHKLHRNDPRRYAGTQARTDAAELLDHSVQAQTADHDGS